MKQVLHLLPIKFIFIALFTSPFVCQVQAQNTLPGHWAALGDGLNGPVTDIYVSGDDVYVAGHFTNAGGHEQADYIARWDGTNWNAIGPRLLGPVYSILVYNDELYAGGNFRNAGFSAEADHIAKWDGEQWLPIGKGVNSIVTSMAFFKGQLYIGGLFSNAGGDPDADRLAYFNGTNWQSLGGNTTFMYPPAISSFETDDEYLYIGGGFLSGIAIKNIAKWDGTNMLSLDKGYAGDMGVTDMDIHQNQVYITGDGIPVGQSYCGVTNWDGKKWNGLSGGLSDCFYGTGGYAIEAFDDGCIVGGNFTSAGNVDGTSCLAFYSGTAWFAFGETNLVDSLNEISAIRHTQNEIYAGGKFENIGDVAGTQNIARWVMEPLSSDIPTKETGVKIFPNPVREYINIELSDPKSNIHFIRIMDLSGHTLYEKQSPDSQIDASFLASGIFIIEIFTKTNMQSSLLVKK